MENFQIYVSFQILYIIFVSGFQYCRALRAEWIHDLSGKHQQFRSVRVSAAILSNPFDIITTDFINSGRHLHLELKLGSIMAPIIQNWNYLCFRAVFEGANAVEEVWF